MAFIDLSHRITANMAIFPGDRPVELKKDKEISEDGYNNFQLCTGMHVGTHMDGPMHLTEDPRYIADFALERFSGPGVLINVQGLKRITLDCIQSLTIKPGSVVLFHSDWDLSFSKEEYFLNYPVLGEDLVNFLSELRVKMIGIDWPSPDKEPYPLHRILLNQGILILENLTNLSLLTGKDFEIFAFPLKIEADSSLVRVVARTS